MEQARTTTLTPGGEAVTDFLLEMFRLSGRVLAAGGRLAADVGLTSARWQVLGAIALAGTSLPVAHFARNMGLTRQAVQRTVNDLADAGMVEFAANPHHRRAKRVVLTARGRDAYDAATELQVPWANGLASGLAVDDIATATRVARSLVRQLEATDDQEEIGER